MKHVLFVLTAVWHFLLLLSSWSSLHYLSLDKSDNSDSQGFCAAGRVVMNGEGLSIFALVEIVQIYLR